MKPTKNPFVKSRAIQGKVYVILNRETFLLDDVGQVIWEKIDGEAELEDILEYVSKKFNVSKEDIKEDILEYLKELNNNRLVTI